MTPRLARSLRFFLLVLALGAFFPRMLAAQTEFIRGEANQDGNVDLTDAVTILGHLFLGSPTSLECRDAADVDDGGSIELTDAIVLLDHLFLAGPPPEAPFPACGIDTTVDDLTCIFAPACRPGCGDALAPRLCGLEPAAKHFSPGDEVTLTGVNFSAALGENRVLFRGRSAALEGTPLRVTFPSDGVAANGLESLLQVLVPGGITGGEVELEVNGVPAGSARFRAAPVLIAFGVGPSAREVRVLHSNLVGFPPISSSTVVLFGLNFAEASEAILTDHFGVEESISRQNLVIARVPGLPPNGLDSLQFSLEGLKRLSVAQDPRAQRDNLTVELAAAGRRSNRLQVPVADIDAPDPTGAVLNGVVVPPGVRTGPVRIHYTMYDHPLVDQTFSMDVQWSADGINYYPAAPDLADPLQSRTRQVLPGDLDAGAPAGLLFPGGALRVFAWDAENDPNFRGLARPAVGQIAGFAIRFRFHPIPEFPELSKPGDTGHILETPPVAYVDLEDADPDLRRGQIAERFDSSDGADPACTTASWGPPANPGQLRGTIPAGRSPLYGEGVADLRLAGARPDALAHFYIADTSRVIILEVVDDGSRVTTAQVFPVPGAPNPGEPEGEFHLHTLTVEEDVALRLEGSRPAVFRVSGAGLAEGDVSVRIDGELLANGEPGSAADWTLPGSGGSGGPGAGGGGAGARMTLETTGEVTELVPSGEGGNQGGGGGETTAAVDAGLTQASRFVGGPGGGGGHRFRGGDGDPGVPRSPTYFSPPRGGRGGPPRGNELLIPLTAGSGGGGGGATISKPAGTVQSGPLAGAGGGGGGGAVQITAHGSMAIGGRIRAAGGKGGDGGYLSAGGGGSGGSILLQATGTISVACDQLEAAGGPPGVGNGQNPRTGSGAGAPGWIRVEAGQGGGPSCTILEAQTELVAPLDTTQSVGKAISVLDSSKLPPRGVVRIDEELIAYAGIDRTSNALQRLTRGVRGTVIAIHRGPPNQARVILEAPLIPPEGHVMVDGLPGGVVPSPDAIRAGTGADGVLHVVAAPPGQGPWIIDTDRGTVRDPAGALVLTAAAAQSDAGLFSFERLLVDAGATLRAVGSRPLRIQVSDAAEIAGVLDLSGFEGGPLEFDSGRPAEPAPGRGGIQGPGGGAGGSGGNIRFKDGDPENKARDNTESVEAGAGQLPAIFPPLFDRSEPASCRMPRPADLRGLETVRATPGGSLRDDPAACGSPEQPCTAGGGGAGGARLAGSDGESLPAGSAACGRGGSTLGLDAFRFEGAPSLLGGQGGAGGGASAYVSDEYRAGFAGESLFRGAARLAPGTGGGGGGGVLHLAVGRALTLRAGSAILARGGDAHQSIDLGGNGGAGGGGSVLIQAAGALQIDPDARIDVTGGRANQPPPVPAGQALPLYEPNLRKSGNSLRAFGGQGGNGAPGRVRIEAPQGSGLLREGGYNESLSSAAFSAAEVRSSACSRPIFPGVGPGGSVKTHRLVPESPVLRFAAGGVSPGAEALLLWKGAGASLDELGAFQQPAGGIEDPAKLPDFEFVQFNVELISNGVSGQTPVIEEVLLPFHLGRPGER